MFREIMYVILLCILVIIEFPLVLIIYLFLNIIYVISVVLEFIFKPFKILFEKLFG